MKKKNAVLDNYIFLLLGLLILIVAAFSAAKFSTLWSIPYGSPWPLSSPNTE